MQSGPSRLSSAISIDLGGSKFIRCIQDRSRGSSTGWLVWPVAVGLCNHLIENAELIHAKSVLELGAGTGVVGITCAYLGARSVFITDLPECISICSGNLEQNQSLLDKETVTNVRTLRWGNREDLEAIRKEMHAVDVIVGSDIIFHQPVEVLSGLVDTIAAASNVSTKVIIAYEDRSGLIDDEEFFFAPMRRLFQSLDTIDIGQDRMIYIFYDFIVS
jgi:predicted nicotinamide N-methyase